MANIKWIINMHNKEVIMEKKTEAVKSNCTSKLDWPISNQCQITNILYKVKITSNFRSYHEKIYCGASEHTFKQPNGNHKKSINQEKHRKYTELSITYKQLARVGFEPTTWAIWSNDGTCLITYMINDLLNGMYIYCICI